MDSQIDGQRYVCAGKKWENFEKPLLDYFVQVFSGFFKISLKF